MTGEIIFYDLVGSPNGPLYSPNTWKTRLSLLHKGVAFRTEEVTCMKLRGELAQRLKKERPLVPMIELPDGTTIENSFEIALWLDRTYPDKPSLFTPSDPKPSQGAHDTAVALARILDVGLGDSDPQWSTFWELSAEPLSKLQQSPADKEYFTSDYKLGAKDAFKGLCSLDREALTERAKLSLLPFAKLLQRPGTKFFASPEAPGFVDYVLFGRYFMLACADLKLADEVFASVEGWKESLLDMYDGHARKLLGRKPWYEQ